MNARKARAATAESIKRRQAATEGFVVMMTRPLRVGFWGRLRWLFFGLPKDWMAHAGD